VKQVDVDFHRVLARGYGVGPVKPQLQGKVPKSPDGGGWRVLDDMEPFEIDGLGKKAALLEHFRDEFGVLALKELFIGAQDGTRRALERGIRREVKIALHNEAKGVCAADSLKDTPQGRRPHLAVVVRQTDEIFRIVLGRIEPAEVLPGLTFGRHRTYRHPFSETEVAEPIGEFLQVGRRKPIGPTFTQRKRLGRLEVGAEAGHLVVLYRVSVLVDDDLRILCHVRSTGTKGKAARLRGVEVRTKVRLRVRVGDTGRFRVRVDRNLFVVDVVEPEGLQEPLRRVNVVVGHDLLERVVIPQRRAS
jgi:hypothetical protein